MLTALGRYLRQHHLGLLALIVALSGTAYAAGLPRNSVTSKQVKNRSLLARDFKRGQLPAGAKGDRGPRGLTGATGLAGSPGQDGEQGTPGLSTGTAGGDLPGNYPNPEIGAGKVGTPELADLGVTADKLGALPAARVGRDTNFTVQNATVTAVPFPSEFAGNGRFDPLDMHNNTTNPERIVVPRTGLYLVAATAAWSGAAGGERETYVRVEGGQILAQDFRSGSVNAQAITVSGLGRLTAGDAVSLGVRQDSGAPLDLLGTNTWLSLVWLGP